MAMTESAPAPRHTGAVLETRGVHKSFGGVSALRGVDVSLGPGEILALVGENGAGKSTLIKVLTGVHQPDSGEVLLGGEPASFNSPADAQRAGISTIYQEVNLVPLLSVARNIFLGREPRNRFGLVDVARMNRESAAALERLGIELDVTSPLGRLGLGAQQMVALARAVSVDSRVVIMDEPTSSLEAREVATLFDVARGLTAAGVGLIFVSHRLDELWALCDRVTILRDGEMVHAGGMQDLDRMQLISHMLGRETNELRGHGTTDFGESHTQDREPVLSVRGLDVRHRLHDVGFDVQPGEVVGLGGLLGSGRSETVKAIYGDLPLEGGQIAVGGKRIRRPGVRAALKSRIALLSEDRKAEGIIPDLSVRDNVALAVLPRMSRWGVVSERRVDALVETFTRRLRIKAAGPHQKVRELSGGNQQKVLIARWLCTEPAVFLLDEPTRGIDVGAKSEVQGLIDELAAQGLGVVLISSELDELTEGADRVVVLHDGAVASELAGDRLTSAALMEALAGDIAAADAALPDGSTAAPAAGTADDERV